MRSTTTSRALTCTLLRQLPLAALSMLLLTPVLQAQPAAPAPQAVVGATQAVAASAKPKYSSGDMDRAFSFMDGNKDGKVSREEASGFRKVAKYFDAADTNKDRVLSRKEFGTALNSATSR